LAALLFHQLVSQLVNVAMTTVAMTTN